MSPSPKSRRISSEILFDNPWHRYRRDRYRLKDGSVGDYYHIDMTGACGVIPLFADGSTVLLQVYRYLLDETLWEFPIGGMQPGDEPLAVAQQELREEAGLMAEEWHLLGRFAPYKGASNETDRFYLARDLRSTEPDLELSEEISAHRMSLSEARRRLFEQTLIDGQSVVGLNLLDRFLASEGA